MTREEAIRDLAVIGVTWAADKSNEQAIRVYDALAQLMPAPNEREAAERIAFTLREGQDLRSQFNELLEKQLKLFPQHNGGAK